MTPTAFQNPACFKLRDTDAILARHGNLWLGVGFSALDGDQAETVFERGDEQVEAHAAAHGFDGGWITPEEARELRAREDRLLACQPGGYPWDDWQREALAAGVPAELAQLGRAVMREAYQHGWCEELREECGAGREAAAQGMIFETLEQPDWARSRWNWLLATDGLRVDPWSRAQASPLDLEWTPLRQQWEDEHFPLADPTGEAALRRDAYRYLEEFFQLDQLAVVSLTDEVFRHDGERTVYYAAFAIVWSPPGGKFYPRIKHRGVIQNRFDPKVSATFDTAVFKQVDEGEPFA
jgi:hypothetical protein